MDTYSLSQPQLEAQPVDYMYAYPDQGYEGYAMGAGMDDNGDEEMDTEEEGQNGEAKLNYKCKPRRKATQKPQVRGCGVLAQDIWTQQTCPERDLPASATSPLPVFTA